MTTNTQDFVDELWSRIDETPPGTDKYQWLCGKDGDRLYYAKQLAAEWQVNLTDIIGERHVCCDCELVFNLMETEPDDQEWD